MRNKTPLYILLAAACLALAPVPASAQSAAPKQGAAEKSDKGWPYPEPAVPGATGFSPDYSEYTELNERWDIYVNLVWRKTNPRTKRDADYYGMEIANFMKSLPSDVRGRFREAKLPQLIDRIRKKQISLPYQDPTTGCLLFMANRSNRTDLAADNCR